MTITLNSKEYELPDSSTLSALIEQLKLNEQRMAVEVNAELIVRKQWPSFVLKPNDKVEVVTFVGGG